MTKEEKNDLIESFLSGRVSEEQVRQVTRLRKEDPEFQMEFEEQQVLWQALGPSKVNAFRGVVAEALAEMPSNRNRNQSNRFFLRTAATAAVLVVLSAVAWWMFKPASDPGERLFAQYFSLPAGYAFFRNPIPDQPSNALARSQQLIDSFYTIKEFRQALDQVEEFGRQFPDARSSEFYFLQGLLYLSDDQPEVALQAFSKVEIGHPYDKDWYSGLAYLKTGNLQQAKSVFSDLTSSNNPYRQEAYAILDALSE